MGGKPKKRRAPPRPYPDELKEQALSELRALLESRDAETSYNRIVSLAARQFGVSPKSLHNWFMRAVIEDYLRVNMTAAEQEAHHSAFKALRKGGVGALIAHNSNFRS